MIVDATVWVAIFRENDVHHVTSVAFLDLAVANQRDLNIPNLALAEIAGAKRGKLGLRLGLYGPYSRCHVWNVMD
jgi:predicted nucleic acid-binding protein